MAILEVNSQWFEEQYSQQLDGTRTAEQRLQIICEDETTLAGDVLTHPLVPALGSLAITDSLLIVVSRRHTRDVDTRNIHYVDIQYTNRLSGTDLSRLEKGNNPIDWDAKIEWETAPYLEPYDVDVDGLPMSNSAGTKASPLPERQNSRWSARVTRYVQTPPAWFMDGYRDAINDASFTLQGVFTIPEGCALISGIRLSDKIKLNGFECYQLGFTLNLKEKRDPWDGETPEDVPAGWDLEYVDAGLQQINPDEGNRLEAIMVAVDSDNDGEIDDYMPTREPVRLDGLGEKLADPIEDPVYLVRKPYKRKDFSVLDLP